MIKRLLAAICFLTMASAANGGVVSTTTATHTLTIVEIAGPGASDLEIVVDLFDLFTFAEGEGTTDATATVTAGGVELDLNMPIAILSEGESVTSTQSAVADRLTVDSGAYAETYVDVNFILPTSADGFVEITMIYTSLVSAQVMGSNEFELGIAFGFAALWVDDEAPQDFEDLLADAIVDSAFDGDSLVTGSIPSTTITLGLDPGDYMQMYFDGVADAIAVKPVEVLIPAVLNLLFEE